MGARAPNELDDELALDRLEAELARELPAHVRAFATSYAHGSALPAAPPAMRRASSADLAWRALRRPALAARARGVLRLIAPTLLGDDPRVAAAARAAASWDALAALADARDRAARARFGVGALALLHGLHGSAAAAEGDARPAAIAGWTDRSESLGVAQLTSLWAWLARRHGGRMVQLVAGRPGTRARTFIVEPGREVIVVHPPLVDTPAARFAVVHEYGHALASFLAPGELPRAVDEAVASYLARLLERPDHIPGGWASPHASAARARRLAIARQLDAIERALPGGARPTERPPWALWHDPGAQASYVAAEAIADAWWERLGPHPVPGALADAIVAERARIDRATGW